MRIGGDEVLMHFRMAYPVAACKCGSRMTEHIRTTKSWLFRCICGRAIDRRIIVELDLLDFQDEECKKQSFLTVKQLVANLLR